MHSWGLVAMVLRGRVNVFQKPGTIFRLMSLVYMQDSCTFGMLADMKTFGGFSLAVNTELLQMSLDVPVADVPVADPRIQSVTLFLGGIMSIHSHVLLLPLAEHKKLSGF